MDVHCFTPGRFEDGRDRIMSSASILGDLGAVSASAQDALRRQRPEVLRSLLLTEIEVGWTANSASDYDLLLSAIEGIKTYESRAILEGSAQKIAPSLNIKPQDTRLVEPKV